MEIYFKEELERKGLDHYVDQMEEIITAREEGKEYRPLACYECFYSMFGKCPVNGSRNSAGCLKMQKSYFDMSRTELEEVTERLYKKALQDAAQLYHIRMDYIKSIAESKGEINNEQEEPEPIH